MVSIIVGAIRSFQEAARLDPQCAMAHWGAALAAGPHINYPLVPPPMAELAWKEITLAKENASNASEVEQALIEALSKRYAYPQPEDRGAARPGLCGGDARSLEEISRMMLTRVRCSRKR